MKKSLILAGMLAIGFANAQEGKVGINTESPNATLDVKAKTNNGSKVLELQNSVGTKLVTTLDNGNVGVGTENPTELLDVYKGDIQASGTNVGEWSNSIQINQGNEWAYFKIMPSQTMFFGNSSDKGYTFPNGNLGIGTLTPTQKLHVAGHTQVGDYENNNPGTLFLDTTTANEGGQITILKDKTHGTQDWHIDQVGGEDNSRLRIFPGTEEEKGMTIIESGNIGIGTKKPLAKLDVLGNIKITDGTQGIGKVLTSNADDSAHWALPAVTYQNYIGKFPDFKGYYPSTEFSTEETEYSRTSFSFTLAPGKYQVFVNGLLSLRPNTMVELPAGGYTTDWSDNSISDASTPIYIRYSFKDSTADTEPSNIYGGVGAGVGAGGYTTLSYPFDQTQINFTTFIENNTSAPKTYYLYARVFRANTTNGKHHTVYDLFNGRWSEESITAVKIGD